MQQTEKHTAPWRRRVVTAQRWLAAAWIICGLALVLLAGLEWLSARILVTQRLRKAEFWKAGFPEQSAQWLDGFAREMDQPALDLELRAGGLQWTPFAYYRGRALQGRHVNVSAAGLRATWSPPTPPADAQVLRVLLFGGSTLWGVGARDEQTIPSQLAKLAAAEGVSLEAVNMGQLAYVNTQELVSLLGELQRGARPHAVVFLDGLNDIHAATLWGQAGASVLERHRQLEFEMLKRPAGDLGLQALQNLSSLRLLGLWLRADSRPLTIKPHQASLEQLRQEIVETYRTNVRAACGLGDRFHFQALHYWQPLLFFKNPKTETERQASARYAPELAAFYRSVYAALEAAQQENSSTIDQVSADLPIQVLGDLFTGNRWAAETVFFDECHLTEAACQHLARRIWDDLKPLCPPQRIEHP